MGPLARQLLFESALVPFIFAGLVMAAHRWFAWRPFAILASALAVLGALFATYLLAFGWPGGLFVDARTKALAAAVAGSCVGIGLHGNSRWSRPALIALIVTIPIMLGLPSLLQTRPESSLLILPIALGIAWTAGIRGSRSPVTARRMVVLMTLAIGLVPIAAFAKVLSLAELSLALGSALLAILIVGRNAILAPAAIAATATLLAFVTALLLYSNASPAALAILAFVLGAERITSITDGWRTARMKRTAFAVACLFPPVLATLIAYIDAGSFSIY